ncbi:MAG: magnesium transporter CorA family protein, partial [Acidimicrobiia bacterium]
DKLLRASEGLELSRDLLASVRDYYQAHVANEQNEVMKRMSAIASLLLLPTLIAGIYGQNFDRIPGQHWASGYWWSLGLIAVVTMLQLGIFRRKGWLGSGEGKS